MMWIQVSMKTHCQRAIAAVIVCIFFVSTNVSLSRSAGATPGSSQPLPAVTRRPSDTPEPPSDPGPIPTVGGGTVTIEPGPTIIVTRRGVVGALSAPDDIAAEARRATPTLDPPATLPGPIPTIGGGTVTIEPGPTITVTRRGIAAKSAAPMGTPQP